MADSEAMDELLRVWIENSKSGSGFNGGDAVDLIENLLVQTGRLTN